MNHLPAKFPLRSTLAASLVALGGCTSLTHIPKSNFPMPAWTLPTADGDSLTASSLRGRPGLLVWVDPTCPDLQDLGGSEGPLKMFETRWMEDPRHIWVAYVASRRPDDPSYMDGPMWKSWLKDQRLRGQVLMDDQGLLAKQWGVDRVPTATLVDSSGQVRWSGPAELASDVFGYPDVSAALDSLLAGRPLPPAQTSPVRGCALKG
jgi:hypothetical protein